jgi:hypothetical protein
VAAKSTPFPYLSARTLRDVYRTFENNRWMTSITLDVRPYDARVDGVQIDTVTLAPRDLYFIHDKDASRFGKHHECPICAS